MYDLGDLLLEQATGRRTARDDALDRWHGPYANDFRNRSIAEDYQVVPTAAGLAEAAGFWGQAWALAVNDMNVVLHLEARERVDQMNASQHSMWNSAQLAYDQAKQEALDAEEDFSGTPPGPYVPITIDPLPDPVGAPAGPGYESPATPFVGYSLSARHMGGRAAASPPAAP